MGVPGIRRATLGRDPSAMAGEQRIVQERDTFPCPFFVMYAIIRKEFLREGVIMGFFRRCPKHHCSLAQRYDQEAKYSDYYCPLCQKEMEERQLGIAPSTKTGSRPIFSIRPVPQWEADIRKRREGPLPGDCPKCRAYDVGEKGYCPRCGANLEQENRRHVQCDCGHRWAGAELYCPKCGAHRSLGFF
jgi:hypothetical protein